MRYIRCLLYSLIFLFTLPSYAALDLELRHGVQAGIPIAIVPFSGNDTSSELMDMAAIINADLQSSGRFQILDRGKILERPKNAEEVNYKTWQNLSLNNLVVGVIRPIESGKYQVNFQLIDLYAHEKNQTQTTPGQTLMISKGFGVSNQGMRQLAHHISDLIYEKLTGEKGIFSTHIAYVVVEKRANIPSQYRLEVADFDGFNQRNILVSKQPLMSPSWSPDGKRIAYVSFEQNRAGIYVQDVATGQRQLVANYPGINGAPAWSRDGNKLAFVLSKEGSPNIYTLELSSGNLTQRTFGNTVDTEPSWSLDGNSLIFTSNRSGGPQIYRLNLSDGAVQRVTYEGNYNSSATYTPDGKSIVFLHQEGGMFTIALQNLQTNKIDILTNSGNDQSPTVAPNGSMILFATKMGTKQVLKLVTVDSHVYSNLPMIEGDVREPDWAPV